MVGRQAAVDLGKGGQEERAHGEGEEVDVDREGLDYGVGYREVGG